MADFIAVIRRAVDGLSDNNAEMRQKVYEKARGAVRRQLESMNPRPSDDLMKRQLDKLEAAIGSVENDHAEALPATEPVPEAIAEPVPVETVTAHEPVAEETVVEEPVAEQTVTVPTERVDEPVEAEATPVYEEPAEVAAQPVEPVPQVHEPAYDEPTVAYEAPVQEQVTHPAEEAVVERAAPAEEVIYEDHDAPNVVEAHTEPSWTVEAAPADNYIPSWEEPVRETTPVEVPPAVESVEAFEAAPQQVYEVHSEQLPEADPVGDARMPDAASQWEWNEAPAAEERKPVSEEPDLLAWEWPQDKVVEPEVKQDKPTDGNAREWGDLDDLIGSASNTAATAGAASAAAGLATGNASAAAETARAPQRSFRAEPRKSRFNLGALAATVAFLALVGGAGAGYWFNRDAVNGWASGLLASVTSLTTSDTPSGTTDTAEGGRSLPANTTPAETAQTLQDNTAASTEVASATPASGGKFTQRLMSDGSEVDSGPAPALDGAAEEGKSVAAQTTETAGVATENNPATTGGEAAATGTNGAAQTDAGAAATTGGQTPAAGGEQAAAIGVTQKMFLYEERLGQSSPTAIEGTVAWSSGEESPGGDAKPEPVVRAQINVPSKGLTALVTFRRNADESLPASHIIELVFSLPENFEGGGIESVQRVAMKRTEQDRGDALIAVPAKITDDFHMIALNDFPEAIAKNTELLRTRSWIDIPITYRNGRRALLTLDKGTAGTEAFDKVMRAWTAAGSRQ